MSDRYTIKDVRVRFAQMVEAADRVGFPGTEEWILSPGSASNGIAYRIHSGNYHSLPFTSGNGFLGMTARDAARSLETIRDVMRAVIELQEEEAVSAVPDGSLVIDHLERLSNSVNGSPRYQVFFTDGTQGVTQSDASISYGLDNPEFRDTPLRVTRSRAGRITHVERRDK